MAITPVSAVAFEEPDFTASSSVAAPAFAAVAGNLIAVCVKWDTSNGTTISSITDTAGNTYSLIAGSHVVVVGEITQQWGYTIAANAHAENVVTANFSSSNPWFKAIDVVQFSGIDAASPQDIVATAFNTSANEIISSSFTTDTADELILVGAIRHNALGEAWAWTPSSYETIAESAGEGNGGRLVVAARIVSEIQTSQAARGDTSTANHKSISVVSFRAGASTPPPEIDDVTPDEIHDGLTGIVIDGSNFGEDEGTVLISPVDDPDGDDPDYPEIEALGADLAVTNGTSNSVPMPSGIEAGDLLLIAVSHDTSGAVGCSGWTDITNQANGSACRLAIFAKLAVGSDTATVTASNNDIAAKSIRISKDLHGITDVSAIPRGTPATGSNGSPNPPSVGSLTAALKYLSLVFAASDDDDDTGSYAPSTYVPVSQHESASSTSSCLLQIASKEITGQTSEDPGNFALGATEEWVTQTLLIPQRPSLGAAVEQDVTAWSDEEIIVTADVDTLPLGGRYLFVVTADDQVSEPYPITLVAAPEDLDAERSEAIEVTDAIAGALRLVRISAPGALDQGVVSESVRAVVGPLVARVSDQAGVLEQVLPLLFQPQLRVVVSDGVSVADQLAAALTAVAQAADDVGISDPVEAQFRLSRLRAEVASALLLVDEAKAVLTPLPARVEAEAVSASDAAMLVLSPTALAFAELLSAVDAASVLLSAVRLVVHQNDLAAVSEASSVVLSPLVGRGGDDLGASDLASLLLSLVRVTVSHADSAGMSDAATLALTPLLVSVVDQMAALDAAEAEIAQTGIRTDVADALGAVDEARLALTVIVGAVEAVLLADAATVQAQFVRLAGLVSDAAQVMDAAHAAVSPIVGRPSESVSVLAVASVELYASAFHILVPESVLSVDTVSAALTPLVVSIAEQAEAVESAVAAIAQMGISASYADAVETAEEARAALTAVAKAASDVMLADETIVQARLVRLVVAASEAAAVLDAAHAALSPIVGHPSEALAVMATATVALHSVVLSLLASEQAAIFEAASVVMSPSIVRASEAVAVLALAEAVLAFMVEMLPVDVADVLGSGDMASVVFRRTPERVYAVGIRLRSGHTVGVQGRTGRVRDVEIR